MIRFDASYFTNAVSHLRMQMAPDIDGESKRKKILMTLNTVSTMLKADIMRELPLSAKAGKRLLTNRDDIDNIEWDDFDSEIWEFLQRIDDEMESKMFFCVETIKSQFYEVHLFSHDVIDRFPSSSYDISEAGKCFALERNTACVFHLMRVLERALVALAKIFNINAVNTNWQAIIDQIEKAIKGISPANAGTSWKDSESFYSEAATQFRHFKNAWRNHTQHARYQYDSDQARHIYEHVRQFMNHLAQRISE